VVVDLAYRRLLSDGVSPRWSVPITVGIEID
jgi:hypothetical protein